MRVALIAPPWVSVPPVGYGGTEAVLDGLARGLHDAGHDVLLVTTGDSTCPVARTWSVARAGGTRSATIPTEISHAVRAYEAALQWGADLVHDHTLVGPLHGRHLGVPVVTTNHGPFDDELTDLYRTVCDRVTVVAISRHQAGTARGVRIGAVIHHGVDLAAIGPAVNSASPRDYALFLGRMSPDKGVDAAVRVAKRAGVPLKIAAKMTDPGEIAFFHDEVEPLLGRDAEYLGEVDATARRGLLAGARCLLNPLRWAEPFGMVMIEALASGTPVVATPCGSVAEIVDDGVTGLLADSEDGLVDAIERVERIDRRACRRAAEERFSSRRMTAQHIELYERVIGRVEIPPPEPDPERSVATPMLAA
jgi:glycosyltransferase involved in cell wall biosynthesis